MGMAGRLFCLRQIFRQSLMASHRNLVELLLMNLRLICSCLLLIEWFLNYRLITDEMD